MTTFTKKRLRRMTPKQRLAVWRKKRAGQDAAAAGLLRLVAAAQTGAELDGLGTLRQRARLFGGIGDDHDRQVRRAVAGRCRRLGVVVAKEVVE
jgi:hypothetical protein